MLDRGYPYFREPDLQGKFAEFATSRHLGE